MNAVSLSPWGFSPPTRGWSVEPHQIGGAEHVLPAHAGVVRRATPDRRGRTRSPRLRGGGPSTASGGRLMPSFSPPTRGWSRDVVRERGLPLSSPRLRGGGPEYYSMSQINPKVLPAYAGVVRKTCTRCGSTWWFSPPTRVWSLHPAGGADLRGGSPRLRGGGPRFWIMLYGASAFSPPTRGSEDVAAEEFLGCVLLAYAG